MADDRSAGVAGPPAALRGGGVGRGVAVVACCALPSFLGGAVVGDVRHSFPVSDAAVGITFAAYWGLAALVALPAARLGSRLGVTRTLRVAGLLSAAVGAAVALLAHSALSFGLLLLGGGVAVALATPAVNVLIMRAVDPRRRAFAFAIATSSPPLSLVAAGTIVPLLGHWLDWRVLYGVAALMAASAALAVRDRSSAAAGGPTPAGVPGSAGGRPPARRSPSLRPLARMMVGVTAGNATIGVMPAFLVVAAPSAGISGRLAAVVMAVAAATSIVARLVMGWRADRSPLDPLISVFGLMVVTVVGFGLMATQQPAAFTFGAFLVLGPGWVWVSLFSFGIITRYAGDAAAASGVIQTGFFAGGVAGPFVFGVLSDVGSYALGWTVLALAVSTAAATVIVGRGRLPARAPAVVE